MIANKTKEEVSEGPPVLTVEETAAFLRLGRTTTYDLVRRGIIPSIKLGKQFRVPRQTLLDWISSNAMSHSSTDTFDNPFLTRRG